MSSNSTNETQALQEATNKLQEFHDFCAKRNIVCLASIANGAGFNFVHSDTLISALGLHAMTKLILEKRSLDNISVSESLSRIMKQETTEALNKPKN